MWNLSLLRILAIGALCLVIQNTYAQATRTWISGVGDDSNPCSRTAPCKTFAGAISKTATGGEINVLDPGGFGGVTITKSISLISRSIEAGVLVSGTNAIVINIGASDRVYIEGLDIEGLGSGLSGIKIIGSGKVIVRDSIIRNFSIGIDVAGLAGTRAYIENTFVTGNNVGIKVAGQSGALNRALIYNSVIDSDITNSLQVGIGSIVTLSKTTLQGAATTISNSGGAIESYGDNIIRGTGTPTTTVTRN